MAGLDLAKVVSCTRRYDWSEGTWALDAGYRAGAATKFHVVAYDYGIKHNILRLLADRGCKLTVVPAQTSARDALALRPDGVFLSNGPGDPEPCDYAIAAIREIVDGGMPTFGICLGHQLLGLASGARTIKMKFGHHGANHPVLDKDTGQVLITSQNHGFAVDAATACERPHYACRCSTAACRASRAPTVRVQLQGHPEAVRAARPAVPLRSLRAVDDDREV
jgi:carbamoyl-phosphate synthase small subunit